MRTPLITSKIEVNRAGKASKYGLELLRLDTDHWKSWVHERIRWPADQLGAWHLPRDVDDDFCMQIVSEARVKLPSGRAQWVQKSRDNHYLDCEAQQAAAGYLLNVQRLAENARRRPRPVAEPEISTAVESAPTAPAAPKTYGVRPPMAVVDDPFL